MAKLGVNIDHIATIRQARLALEPDPVFAASLCEIAGADGITVHLREDRRHIQDRDVRILRQTIKTKLNLEMAGTDEIMKIVLDIKPDDVCLVPEKRQELTTEGGLDAASQKKSLETVIKKLQSQGIRVSIFVDPDEKQIRACADIGADCVELHTGKYAEFCKRRLGHSAVCVDELKRLRDAAILARSLKLILNAGHGLDYKNVIEVARIPEINELNIGFSIIARAALVGLERAVREMKEMIVR